MPVWLERAASVCVDPLTHVLHPGFLYATERNAMSEVRKDYWKRWAKAAGVRAIKTLAQTAAATIGVATVMSEVDWIAVASASILAAVLSMLTSVSGLPEVEEIGND